MLRVAFLVCLFAGLASANEPHPEATSTPNAFADDGPADIWKTSCAMCHGKDGSAQTWLGKRNKVRDLTDPAWKSKASASEIQDAIRDGRAGTKMKSFESKMSASQLVALSQWVQKLGTPEVAQK